MSIFNPDFIFDDVSHISPELLKGLGIRAVFVDLDGTLCHIHNRECPDFAANWLKQLKDCGITVFVLSNNKNYDRVQMFCDTYGINYFINRAKKPLISGFREALETLSLPKSSVAIIGDQIYTDVLGGNRFGIRTFLVNSIDKDAAYIKIRRLFELPFCREKKGSKT